MTYIFQQQLPVMWHSKAKTTASSGFTASEQSNFVGLCSILPFNFLMPGPVPNHSIGQALKPYDIRTHIRTQGKTF